MVEFDLDQTIFKEIVKHAEKVHGRSFLPFQSLIFQILHKKNLRVVRATKQVEKPVPELKFSHKCLEGKHTTNEPKEEPVGIDDWRIVRLRDEAKICK